MKEKIISSIIILLSFLFLSASIVFSTPAGPTTIETVQSNSRDNFGGSAQEIQAQAGNITQLVITTTTATKRWQGYYGNITGEITLDDANNWTMFSWDSISRPEGEVYAANGTVLNWENIICTNLSTELSGYNCTGTNETCLNITMIESNYGMLSGDSDGVDETFNETLSYLLVGTKPLSNCPMVSLYVNGSNPGQGYWNETLLTINNTHTIIYTSIIRSDDYGFNNQTTDFQMIVGEDGDVAALTTYSFYVELS